MHYYLPTEFHFGNGVLKEHGKRIATFGKKAILVTGRNSARKSGVLDDLLPILDKAEIEYKIYSEIQENPTIYSVLTGAKLFQDVQADMVIGIGGGSPIDAAKAISIAARNNFTQKEFYHPEKIKNAFPVIAIPTTSGTGTEVTPYSVLTDTKIQRKAGFGNPLIFPKLSFLDPAYTLTLPEKVTIDTSIDALSHLLEGLYSQKRNRINYPIIFNGISLILKYLPLCVNNLNNVEYREKLMIASLYGGMVIAQSGTTLQHSIGYPLTSILGLSHGEANGVDMEHIMDLFYSSLPDLLDNLFEYLSISRNDFYHWLKQFHFSLPKLLDEDFYEKRIPEVMKSRNMALNPRQISAEEVKAIYQKMIVK